jgi:hypothetical protein
MARTRRSSLAATLAAGALLALAVGTADAGGSPRATFTLSICQTQVESFDDQGNDLGPVPAIEMLYSWSGAYVDNVSGSWTRSDGQPVLFGFDDSDFAAARSGNVDAGALTVITDDPGFDGLTGSFQVNRHVLATRNILESTYGSWTSVPACA